MVGIQSPSAENRAGKKEEKKKIEGKKEERNYRMKILWSALLHRATIKIETAATKYNVHICYTQSVHN